MALLQQACSYCFTHASAKCSYAPVPLVWSRSTPWLCRCSSICCHPLSNTLAMHLICVTWYYWDVCILCPIYLCHNGCGTWPGKNHQAGIVRLTGRVEAIVPLESMPFGSHPTPSLCHHCLCRPWGAHHRHPLAAPLQLVLLLPSQTWRALATRVTCVCNVVSTTPSNSTRGCLSFSGIDLERFAAF